MVENKKQLSPKENDNYFISYLKNNIRRNKNNILLIAGATGSGKSYAGLSLSEDLDPNFTVDNVVFQAKHFIDIMKKENRHKITPGSTYIWDEVSCTLDAKNWWSLVNKSINYVLQTFRSFNINLIFTTPAQSFLDSSARRLLHFLLITDTINYRKELCYIKPLKIEIDPRTNKPYHKYLIDPRDNCQISRYACRLPSKGLIEAYEKEKTKFQDVLYESVHREVDKFDILAKKKPRDTDKRRYKLWKEGKKQTEIAKIEGTNTVSIHRSITICKDFFSDYEE